MGQRLDVQFAICIKTANTVHDYRFSKRPLFAAPGTASANRTASTVEAHRQLPWDYRHFIEPDQKRACKSMRLKIKASFITCRMASVFRTELHSFD